MKQSLLVSLIPGIFGFAAMAALGWYLPHPSSSGGPDQRPSDRGPERNRSSESRRTRDLVTAQVRAVRSAGSPKERLRSAAALAKAIPASEFAAWVEGDRFDFREGPELSVFRMIIFERWIKEAPETLIPWAGKNNYGQAGRALQALARESPAVLLDHYRNNPGDRAELQVLTEVAKSHPTLALQRLHELSGQGLPPGSDWQVRELLDQLASKSPSALEAVVSTFPAELREGAERTLCAKRLETSFKTELTALFERPDGLRLFTGIASGNPGVAARLLEDLGSLPENWKASLATNSSSFIDGSNGKQWFDADLEGAGITEAQAKSIRTSALRELAFHDPAFALSHLDDADPAMKASILSLALRNVGTDEEAAGKLIGLIGNEEDRQKARDQLALSNKSSSPAEWLEKIGSDESLLSNPYRTFDRLDNWSEADIGELREKFKTLPDDKKQLVARMVAVSSGYVKVSPEFAGEAIRFLVTHPPADSSGRNNNPVSASSTHAVHLVLDDPATATAWVNTLPDGEAKMWAFKNMAANWKQYDPKAVTEWLATLPAGTRDEVSKHLKHQR